jgi:hypothetical protein
VDAAGDLIHTGHERAKDLHLAGEVRVDRDAGGPCCPGDLLNRRLDEGFKVNSSARAFGY